MNQNATIFLEENAFENVICKLAAILSRPHSVYGMRTIAIFFDETKINIVSLFHFPNGFAY